MQQFMNKKNRLSETSQINRRNYFKHENGGVHHVDDEIDREIKLVV